MALKKNIPFCLMLLLSIYSSGFSQNLTAYTGAAIIDGTGREPIKNGVLLVQNGFITAVGAADKTPIPRNAAIVHLAGKTIMPGIINAHGHIKDTDYLRIYARYGITTVVSLGDDIKESEPLREVKDSLSHQRSRLFIAGEVISGNTPGAAIAVIERNHKMGVDFMKIRVDDQLGTGSKMTEPVFRAVINRSHELGYKLAAHMYYLEDARKLADAGADLLAHSVRDLAIDNDFIQLLKKRNTGYCPTLTRELSTFVYGDTAAFFSDPFFRASYDAKTIQPLLDPARQKEVRSSISAQTYQRQLPVAMANLKALSDAGVAIVFGTDSGMPNRFVGYFEHLEMKMMADAGMSAMQIIVSGTKNAADQMGLKKLGILAPGNHADFLILDADPLEDITNCRKINAVYIGGVVIGIR